MCSFCGEQEETVEHMFIYCNYVKELWLRTEPWMSKRFGENPPIHFQVETVLFNKLVPEWGLVKNFICLLVKYYVYRQRCLKEAISFSSLQQYITIKIITVVSAFPKGMHELKVIIFCKSRPFNCSLKL